MQKTLNIFVSDIRVGTLVKDIGEQGSTYTFTYLKDVNKIHFVSLLMPVRKEPYISRVMPAIFQQIIPEGRRRENLERLGKLVSVDDMGLLHLVGSNTVGRVKAAKGRLQASSNVNVSELIESPEAKEVFNQILEDSGFKSGVSGVQPKILGDQVSDSFETSITPTHILKSSESNTPYLSINEYICMTMASNSNIEIPGIQLSKDGEILAVTRFDLDGAGLPIGFEKAATLSDKPWLDKYSGAMEDVINIIDEHVEVGLSISNLEQIFRATVVNCIVKNGDAHMKNFGFIYGNELGAKDIGLSPTYDVVCTTAYISADIPALALDYKDYVKRWPTKTELINFGKDHCFMSLGKINEVFYDVAIAALKMKESINYYIRQYPGFEVVGNRMMASLKDSCSEYELGKTDNDN